MRGAEGVRTPDLLNAIQGTRSRLPISQNVITSHSVLLPVRLPCCLGIPGSGRQNFDIRRHMLEV